MKTFPYGALPFVRILLPFILGRTLSLFLPVQSLLYGVFGALICFLVVYLVFRFERKYSARWLTGVVISIVLFLGGWVNNPIDDIKPDYNQELVYTGTASKVIRDNLKYQTVELVCGIDGEGESSWFKVHCVYYKDSMNHALLPGDRIAFKSCLQKVEPNNNPYAFNYALYLKKRNVLGQFFLHSNKCVRLETGFSIQRYLYLLRKWCEARIDHLEFSAREKGILSALLIGSKSDLDYNIKSDFSGAGIIHVISISGMHVGIIYFLLMFLFISFKKPGLRLVKLFVVLFCLWFYAALTGMSPSVFRATVMFSVFAISKHYNLHYSIYHSLAISAFIILLFTPEAFLHLGFWFSFLAVASIVYFYPMINGLVYFKTPWMRFIWNLSSLSLAAQIGTAPLGVFVFGYFPIWFLLSNIIVVPVIPFVFIGGFILLFFDSSFIINELLKDSVEEVVGFIIKFSHWINDLPFSKFSGIQLTGVELFGLYVAICALVVFLINKRTFFLKMTLLIFVIVLGYNIENAFQRISEERIVVHDVRGHTAVTCFSSLGDCFLCDSISAKMVEQSVVPLWNHHLKSEVEQVCIKDRAIEFIANGSCAMIVLNGNIDVSFLETVSNDLDYIVLTNRVSTNQLSSILQYAGSKKVVFDSSYSGYRANQLSKRFKTKNKNLYFVSLQGALCL